MLTPYVNRVHTSELEDVMIHVVVYYSNTIIHSHDIVKNIGVGSGRAGGARAPPPPEFSTGGAPISLKSADSKPLKH